MTKIILSGACGRMGRAIHRLTEKNDAVTVVAGVDPFGKAYADFPLYAAFEDVKEEADVVVDFSNVAAIETGLLDFCISRKLPLVLATTGHSPEQLEKIAEAQKSIAIFRSANMSMGVNLLADLIKRAASVLGEGYDVEIIEKHHNQKLDAPSGTALMLADEVKSALPYEAEYCYDRHERREKRPAHEIGIHAVRGGTIVGEHEIMFCGPDEVITIAHSALTREAFAGGAVKAAQFLAGKTAGAYGMKDLLANI
ncbi:MAG: 4-hydroxy-tetrahydrodipicolinate reductase [Ruminococcaceae bacterium]|nr:4-hydroxy-tetrahydrodipicolinate reductase [Oscillospiraceae bacterium]